MAAGQILIHDVISILLTLINIISIYLIVPAIATLTLSLLSSTCVIRVICVIHNFLEGCNNSLFTGFYITGYYLARLLCLFVFLSDYLSVCLSVTRFPPAEFLKILHTCVSQMTIILTNLPSPVIGVSRISH